MSILIINPYKQIAPIPGTHLLDIIGASADIAYSLRRVRTDHSGPVITLRRENDNTEQDFFFAGDELDWAAISFFGSGTILRLKTWYDQSGHGNHATQTDPARQPQLGSSTEGVIFDGTQLTGAFVIPVDMSTTHKVSTISVWQMPLPAVDRTIFRWDGVSTRNIIAVSVSSTNTLTYLVTASHQNASRSISGAADDTLRLLITTVDREVLNVNFIQLYLDGVTGTHASATQQTVNDFDNSNWRIGAGNVAGGEFIGKMRELITYSTALNSTQIDNAEANIGTYYAL